jgi:hypothetical protein
VALWLSTLTCPSWAFKSRRSPPRSTSPRSQKYAKARIPRKTHHSLIGCFETYIVFKRLVKHRRPRLLHSENPVRRGKCQNVLKMYAFMSRDICTEVCFSDICHYVLQHDDGRVSNSIGIQVNFPGHVYSACELVFSSLFPSTKLAYL